MNPWKGKRILIVSPEAWGDARLSKHHYARALADAGSTVFFLGPGTGDPGRIIARRSEAITVVDAPPLPRGLRFLPSCLAARFEERYLEKIISACDGGFDILWNFDLYRFRWGRSTGSVGLRILHIMDLPIPGHLSAPASIADVVLCVSPGMIRHVPNSIEHVLHVPHGISLPSAEHMKNLPQLRPGSRACYLGNFAIRYLDLVSLLSIAERHPEVDLYLIGPVGGALGGNTTVAPDAWRSLMALPNVIHVGQIPSSEVQSWLAQMDLLLIAYNSELYPTETAHPHKLLEYLYSGKTILSSHLLDSTNLGHLIEMMPPKVPISRGFDKVIGELHRTNDPELQRARKAYARSMTYDRHINTIGAYLRSKGLMP